MTVPSITTTDGVALRILSRRRILNQHHPYQNSNLLDPTLLCYELLYVLPRAQAAVEVVLLRLERLNHMDPTLAAHERPPFIIQTRRRIPFKQANSIVVSRLVSFTPRMHKV